MDRVELDEAWRPAMAGLANRTGRLVAHDWHRHSASLPILSLHAAGMADSVEGKAYKTIARGGVVTSHAL